MIQYEEVKVRNDTLVNQTSQWEDNNNNNDNQSELHHLPDQSDDELVASLVALLAEKKVKIQRTKRG